MECLLYDCRISPGNFKLQLSDLEFNHIKTAVRIGGGFTTGFEKYWRMIFIFKKVIIFTTPVLVTSNNYSTHIHNNKWNFFCGTRFIKSYCTGRQKFHLLLRSFTLQM